MLMERKIENELKLEQKRNEILELQRRKMMVDQNLKNKAY
jgi:ATP-dependent 26S proteasome regulatory subunit